MTKSFVVAEDETVIIIIIARVHFYILGQLSPHINLSIGRKQRDLYAVNLRLIFTDDRKADLHGIIQSICPPIVAQLRIKHFTEPVQNHWLAKPISNFFKYIYIINFF